LSYLPLSSLVGMRGPILIEASIRLIKVFAQSEMERL
jgi:hypothetical protein